MSFDSSAATPHRARTALNQLAELGIKQLPKPVVAAADQLTTIEAFRPPTADRHALRDAVLSGATADELHALVLAELADQRIREAAGQALMVAATAVLDSIRAAHNDIHAQLAKLADAAIVKLQAVAALGDVALEKLIADGRHRDAETIVAANIVERQLQNLYQVRGRLLWPRNRHPVVDVTVWRRPDLNGRGFIDGLRTDPNALWFPSYREAAALGSQLHAEADEGGRAALAGTK